MSERGSFVTEYVYCPKCFVAAKSVLLERHKYLCSITLPSWEKIEDDDGHTLPIIAGKIGGLYPGEELDSINDGFRRDLAPLLCHPLRIAVLAEQGQAIFTIQPGHLEMEHDD